MTGVAKSGWIEVICGSMFSGKTEELIRRLRRAMIAKQRVEIFKPSMDTRFDENYVESHSKQQISSKSIAKAQDILELIDPETRVVGLDEAQFMGPGLPGVANELANRGLRVVVAGLDQDYLGRPFEPIPQLMAIAEYVTKCQAICVVCGKPASRSQRIVADTDRVRIGASEAYEARCRRCFDSSLSERMTASRRNDTEMSLLREADNQRGQEGNLDFSERL